MVSASTLMITFGRAISLAGNNYVYSKLGEILEEYSDSDIDTKLAEFIIDTTCNHYNIPVSEIKRPKVSGDASIVQKMCIVLLDTHMEDKSHKSIGKKIGKSTATISTTMAQFNQMTKKIKHEREFIETYNVLNLKIKEHKLNIQQP